MTVKLSIIIPFYNVVDYIEKSINSIMTASDFSYEVLLVDDGSTDGSHEVAKKFDQIYDNVKLIVQENRGLGAARNLGVQHATGEYIVFLDSDDIIVEGAYSKMLHQIDESGSDFIVGNVARLNVQGIWYSSLHKNAFPNTVSGVTIYSNPELINDTTAWNKIIRRSFWKQKKALFPEGVLYEDIPIILPLYTQAKVDVYSDLMYQWRSRSAGDASITQAHDYKNIHDRILAVNHVYEYFKQNARELLPYYNNKVLTNDFQIYLREFYKQETDLFDYVYGNVNAYLSNIEIKDLSNLPIHLRIQYTLIKADYKTKLLDYLQTYRNGEIVNVEVIVNNKRVIANSWSHELPQEIRFSQVDLQYSENLNNGHIENDAYILDIRRRIPYLFIDEPKFSAQIDSGQNTVPVAVTKKFSFFKKLMIELFAAEELKRLNLNIDKKHSLKAFWGSKIRSILGDERFLKMRLQTRRPNLPYLLKINITKNLQGTVQIRDEFNKVSYIDVYSQRPATRMIPYQLNEQNLVAYADSQWQLSFKTCHVKMDEVYKNKVRVAAKIETNGFLLTILDDLDFDAHLILKSATDSKKITLESNEAHIGPDFTERFYQVYLQDQSTNAMYPVKLVKTQNFSYEQTVLIQQRAMQLQQWDTAETLEFKQWQPMKWYEGTPLRRQAFKGIVYPFLRKLPLKNVMVYGSFWGKNFSDNPRAIYQYAQEHSVSSKQVAVLQHNLGQYANLKNITFVKAGSFKYYSVMARAHYLFNNVNFDDDYVKRSDQIEVQTMHGTPLKKLGLDSPGEIAASDIAKYIKKNQRWDYLTVPSQYVAEISKSAFNHKASILPVGYPRNDELFSNNVVVKKNEIKEQLGISTDKKIILYAPTWRIKGEFTPQIDFERLQNELNENTFLILKLHQFMTFKKLPQSLSKFVKVIGDELEISELYLIADVLVTDYSSVMFDYAVLKRPMIFYVYDYDKYSKTMRPLYFDFKNEAPGKLAYTQNELTQALNALDSYELDYADKILSFREKFVQYDRGTASRDTLLKLGIINED